MSVDKDLCIPCDWLKGYSVSVFKNFSINFLNNLKIRDLFGNSPRFFFDHSEITIKTILTKLDTAFQSFSNPLIYSITDRKFMEHNHFIQISQQSVDYSNFHFSIPWVIKIILENNLCKEKLINVKEEVKKNEVFRCSK
jgi:hypothetical protein